MSTEPTKHWKRWTQTSPTNPNHFPKPKYRFTELLKKTGDYVTTIPLNKADTDRINDAAKFWAWYHDKRVRIKRNRVGEGLWTVTVMLIAHHRHDSHRKTRVEQLDT